ncbi:MAG: ATP-binding protein [Desulfobacterales bacterium]
MQLKLAYKIFAAFLLTSFIVVVLMIGGMRYIVSRNFADYVNQTALDRLDALVEALSAEYQRDQGWQHLKDRPDLWRDILRSVRPWREFDRRPSPETDEPAGPPVPGPHAAHDGNPPGAEDPGLPPEKSAAHLRRRLPRGLSLFDDQKQHIAGWPLRGAPDSYSLREITVNDRIVGWLGLYKRENLSNPLVVSFIKAQSLAFYTIGGGILLLAAIVSFLLSKHLLAPIRQLTAGTRALTAFEFGTKIDVRTKDELGQLAADFNRMADTLKNFEKMRRQWIVDISHELRTPLAILKGEIEALQDGVRNPTEDNLASLQSEVDRLSKLVEDLHLLSLADTKNLLTRKDDIAPLDILQQIITHYQNRLASRKIDVHLELKTGSTVTLEGDADRLARLFINLLENTLRYTDSPGILKIKALRTDSRLTISFEDTGPGVPPEAIGRLFDRLYRVDTSRSRELGGSGLGLAICKQIVEAHGGTIQAANASSGGLQIRIELPLDSASPVR